MNLNFTLDEFILACIIICLIYSIHIIYFFQKVGLKKFYLFFINLTTAGALTETYHHQYKVSWENDIFQLLKISISLFLILSLINILIYYLYYYKRSFSLKYKYPKYQLILLAFFVFYFISGLFFSENYVFKVINQGTKDLISSGHLYSRFYDFASHKYPYPPVFPLFSSLFYILPLKDIYCMRLALSTSQIILLYSIYKLSENMFPKFKYSIMILIGTNPIFTYFVVVHTQFDSLCIAFFIFSLYNLSQNKYISSSIFLGVSIATKYFPALFIYFILVFIYKNTKNIKLVFGYLSMSILTICLIYFPFLIIDGFNDAFDGFFYVTIQRDPVGFSLTSMFFRINQNFSYLSLFLPISYVVYAGYVYKISEKMDIKKLNLYFINSLSIFYLFSKSLHFQYFVWFFVFYLFLKISNINENRSYI